MRAHIIENGVVVNTIEVEDLEVFPNLIDAELGGQIGDAWDGENFVSPEGETISQKKERIWEEIKEYRALRLGGGFYLDPHWYHSDLSSKTEFNTLKMKALERRIDGGNLGDTIVIDGGVTKIKTIDNGYVDVTYNSILAIVAAGEIQTKRTYEVAAYHQYFLNASNNPDDYNWHTGWPAIYE